MYINKGIKKNVSDAKIMDCKYLKFEEDYLFYLALKAIEQENHGCVPLDELGQKAWQKFKRRDAKITALEDLSISTLEQDKTPLTTTSDFVRYIGAFAVDVFNKCYQMYINKGIKKNVSDAKIMDCKNLKFEEDYIFYVTLKAIEQENHGVYETTIKCEFDDYAIIKGSKFSPESTYETVTG
nr:hypothetical protein [Tanacetum cinerariifolium]